MPAPKGNKYAEKWTKENTLDFLEKVITYIQENKKQYHLGMCLVECGGYPQIWSYICEKFESDDEVFEAIKKAELLLESRIVNSTMTGDIKSAAMAIFYLKNKHGYKDKTETELTGANGKDLIPDQQYNGKEYAEYLAKKHGI